MAFELYRIDSPSQTTFMGRFNPRGLLEHVQLTRGFYTVYSQVKLTAQWSAVIASHPERGNVILGYTCKRQRILPVFQVEVETVTNLYFVQGQTSLECQQLVEQSTGLRTLLE